MRAFDLVAALALPDGALVGRRVPKTLLLENGAPAAADKRLIREGVEELRWTAVLKPATVGVAEYRGAAREYLEIAVLELTLRPGARADRLAELVHRAVPYPLLLAARQGDKLELSLAHKRRSQSEAGKTVLDGGVIAVRLGGGCADEPAAAFCGALAVTGRPCATLYALYQGWVDALQALRAARITGGFSLPASPEQAADRAAALQEYAGLVAAIAALETAAGREKQLQRRVEMNLRLQRLRADRDAARARL